MKGLRNLLVHEYGRFDDRIVFETMSRRLGDFEDFKHEVLAFLQKQRVKGYLRESFTRRNSPEEIVQGLTVLGHSGVNSRPRSSAMLFTESPGPLLVAPDGPQEVDLPEGRPVGIAE